MFEASWVPRGSGGPIKTLVRFLPAVDVVYVLSWLLGLTLGPPTAAAPDRRPTAMSTATAPPSASSARSPAGSPSATSWSPRSPAS
jgi:hypothetical protein